MDLIKNSDLMQSQITKIENFFVSFNNFKQIEIDQIKNFFNKISLSKNNLKHIEIDRINNFFNKINISKKNVWWTTYSETFESKWGLANYEREWNSIIASLFNKNGSHNLNDRFLRYFFKFITENELPEGSKVDISSNEERKFNRNSLFFDIVINVNNYYTLVIELKVKSKEGSGQTLRYAEYWKQKGRIDKQKGRMDEKIFLIFLSPKGENPESKDFKPVSFYTVKKLLVKFRNELIEENKQTVEIDKIIKNIC